MYTYSRCNLTLYNIIVVLEIQVLTHNHISKRRVVVVVVVVISIRAQYYRAGIMYYYIDDIITINLPDSEFHEYILLT